MQEICWIGPFKIRELLEGSLTGLVEQAPESDSVYVVTQHAWEGAPKPEANTLYIGGNTGRSKRFRTRIGDLLADAFGFFTSERGHHSGGQSIRKWTLKQQVNVLDLYIAWAAVADCHRCIEGDVFQALKPKLNKNTPPMCSAHRAE